ncbi:glycosyltransferase family 4 protein [Pseudoduganella namucuonensis]|uniref:Glycosyltransferase involved in cell wall bisynthesis n=1 Tax=Pseudoduganella namucuonensis TaxID=1035707 RepID=A0A1I7I0K1_9BURK|nr:glycosyltransferase family 4 protein [Pseudoduganella namucuonensis]SFU66479.1 Glycosyltransferase involved in cell wall bisynthesis [Pseudoduganella namucuonensis]
MGNVNQTAGQAAQVLMIGTSLDSPGGMTAVVRLYRDMGLFEAWNIRYLASYEKPGVPTQLRVMAGALLTTLWLLLRGKVGLLHVHSASRGSFWRKSVFCALARLFGVPYVFHLHSGEFPVFYRDECGPRARRWVERTLRGAHTVVALTGLWRESLRRIAPGANVTVLGNPVRVPAALPPAPPPRGQVLFLGRLRDKKGVYDIVRAMPAVLARAPDTVFTLAGDGDLHGTARLAEELGVAHALRLPGWVDGAAKDALMDGADLLLLPSYFEGLPICVLEAMAQGVAVVASNVGGIPEALEQGRCGALLAPGDVEAISSAVLSLLADEGRRLRLRGAAHARAQQVYSTQAVTSSMSALYRAVLAPPQGAHYVR